MRRRLAQLTDTKQLATSLIWDDGDCTIQNRERGSHCASEARRHDTTAYNDGPVSRKKLSAREKLS